MRRNYTDQPSSPAPTLLRARFARVLSAVGKALFLLFCMAGTAGLLYASYPKVSCPFAAWLALAPFCWGLVKIRGYWGSCLYGWLTSLFFHAGALYWVYYTCVHGGGLTVSLAAAAWLGLSALLALQMAFFAGSCYFLKKTGAFFPLLAACGWVALEWAHQLLAFYGLGFPWFMLGNTQWNFPPALQLAAYTGVYGISFVLAFTGLSAGWAFARPHFARMLGHFVLAGLVFFGVCELGSRRLARVHPSRSFQPLLSVQAALMQPNIDQYKKWDEAFEAEIMDTLAGQGRELGENKVMLAIWPESTSPGPLVQAKYASLFEGIAVSSGAYQLVGSYIPGEKEQAVGAYLIPPDLGYWQVYKKVKLVPFGEFIPFEKSLRQLFPGVEVLGELGDFSAGRADQPLLDMQGVLLGSTICYEAIFPHLWRIQNQQGARFFVNITNDAWFFDTAAPYQHLAANVLRAVETGRPVLRAANTGFSAVIDPFGRIQQLSQLFAREILRAEVPLPIGDKTTFYTQRGDWFAWLCAVIFLTLLISTMVFAYE